MELKHITAEQKALLDKPLPPEAIKPHPTKNYLSTIKAIYVTERLNEVFGVGGWCIKSDVVERDNKMIVVKISFSVPEYGIEYESYGGNDNSDRGDAYKGAVTDAITKIGSWLGIGADVFKGLGGSSTNGATKTATQSMPNPKCKRVISEAMMKIPENRDKTVVWLHNAAVAMPDKPIKDILTNTYDVEDPALAIILDTYMEKYGI